MTRFFLFGIAVGGILVSTLGHSARASKLVRDGVFLYSNLCVERESGDASGYRVKLMRATEGDRLYLDWSEGGLYGPMLAQNLTIDPRTADITFTIPANTPPSDMPDAKIYHGKISNEAVILDGITVPRVKAFDDKIGRCKEPRIEGH
jgi:hypothetical protein